MPDCARCSHPYEWHVHLRDGDDCGMCSIEDCRGYKQPPGRLRRWLERWLR
jgi:hypothetical protein